MTWHDGVMSLARVMGSCHGLRDSIVTLRDGAVTSAVSATALTLCSYHCLQYQSLLNMMGTFHKSHGLTGSFICPHALNTRSGVRDQVSDDGCAMDMGRGDVTSDNETVWAWPQSTGNGAMVRTSIVSRERLRDGVTLRDMWHVMCDVLTDTRPLSLGGVSSLSAY